MPSLIYEGERYVKTKHAMKCLSCLEIVESKFIHDFKSCKCGKVSVDGGITAGNRVLGHPKDMEDCSVWKTEGFPRKILPQHVLDERLRVILTQMKY